MKNEHTNHRKIIAKLYGKLFTMVIAGMAAGTFASGADGSVSGQSRLHFRHRRQINNAGS